MKNTVGLFFAMSRFDGRLIYFCDKMKDGRVVFRVE